MANEGLQAVCPSAATVTGRAAPLVTKTVISVGNEGSGDETQHLQQTSQIMKVCIIGWGKETTRERGVSPLLHTVRATASPLMTCIFSQRPPCAWPGIAYSPTQDRPFSWG